MEALISQFTFLSDQQALQEKNFDPSTIEDLMRLFEIESYKAWAGMELEQEKELEKEEEEEEFAMQQEADDDDEDYLDSVMESAMDELRCFEQELERMSSKAEMESLIVETDDYAESTATNMASLIERAASIASKRYIEAAVSSAAASMKSAWKGLSSSGKVHPH